MRGIPLDGKKVSGDSAMDKVIDIQSKMSAMRKELDALRKDRAELLSEYTDMQSARKLIVAPAVARKTAGHERIRVSAGDVHGMMMDKGAVAAFLADVKLLDPDEVVLGGDITECGGWLAKHQPVGFIALCDYSYQEDIAAANWFLDELQTAAPSAKIYFVEGNHEDRLERWITDQTMAHKRDSIFLHSLCSPQVLLHLKERGIEYFSRHEIYAEGFPRGWIKLGKMCFTHSLTYSKNAARDALGKAAANITYFCTHREDTATGVLPGTGIVKAFNPGCLCSMQPVWQNSNPTNWSQGYAVDLIDEDETFQRIHVTIWRGRSLAGALVRRFATHKEIL